jgi:seryl-tRNA synthetase
MIDPKFLRSDIQEVAEKLLTKNFQLDCESFNLLDIERKSLQSKLEKLLQERNSHAKKIGMKITENGPADNNVKESKIIGEDLKNQSNQIETELSAVKHKINAILEIIPNLPDSSVPKGKGEEDNLVIRKWGSPKTFGFDVLDHVELGNNIGQMDFDVATKITGSRFMQLSGQLASLHRALIQFMLDTHINENGYEEVYVPYIVNSKSLWSTGQLPKFENDQFKIDDERNYYLIPTAEVPVTNIYRDVIVDQLPKKYVAHTPCFRSEAGSYGKDTRGMIRQHQFEKVELVHFVEPQNSWQTFEQLVAHAESILQKLELPYQVVNLCGGDLGFSSAKTYDLEVWVPSQGRYREISSCSNFLDFQARRLKARFKKDGKIELMHTLNGSGLAVGRTLLAVMENYQEEGGRRIKIPTVLQGYMNGSEYISGSKG